MNERVRRPGRPRKSGNSGTGTGPGASGNGASGNGNGAGSGAGNGVDGTPASNGTGPGRPGPGTRTASGNGAGPAGGVVGESTAGRSAPDPQVRPGDETGTETGQQQTDSRAQTATAPAPGPEIILTEPPVRVRDREADRERKRRQRAAAKAAAGPVGPTEVHKQTTETVLQVLDAIALTVAGPDALLSESERSNLADPMSRILSRLDDQVIEKVQQVGDPLAVLVVLGSWGSRVVALRRDKVTRDRALAGIGPDIGQAAAAPAGQAAPVVDLVPGNGESSIVAPAPAGVVFEEV